MAKQYWVYILASHSRRLYTGVTNDLARRVAEHQAGTGSSFTRRYRTHRLVYFEEHPDIRDAIRREKEIKGWTREKKLRLIERANTGWLDLGRPLHESWRRGGVSGPWTPDGRRA